MNSIHPMHTTLIWSMNVRDIPWIHVETKQQPHAIRNQAFVEIIGKLSHVAPFHSYFFLVPFYPYIHINLPYEWTPQKCQNWSMELHQTCRAGMFREANIHYHNRQPMHTCLSTRVCTTIEYSFHTIAECKQFVKHLLELEQQSHACLNEIRPISDRIWETPKTVPDTLKVAMTSAVRPSVWVDVQKTYCARMPSRFMITTTTTTTNQTHMYDEWFVPDLKHFTEHITKPGEPELSPYLRLVSFDGEMYSRTGKFTMPENDDPIINLGNTIMDLVDGQPTKMRNVIFCLLDAEQDPNFKYNSVEDNIPIEIRSFATERELLLAWRQFIFEQIDPDILTGYNTYQFDLPYIAKRAQQLLKESDKKDFYQFGRKMNELSKFRLPTEKEIEHRKRMARRKGGNKVTIPCPIQMFGRVVLDMMIWVKKLQGFSPKSYKLDVVAETFLKKHKIDLKPSVMFEHFRRNKYTRYEIARYCAVDCILVLEIMINQNTCIRELAMSRHTRTDIGVVVACGQQKKCFNLMMVYGFSRKYLCNYTDSKKSVQSWIYPPQKGVAYQEGVGWCRDGNDWDMEMEEENDEDSKKFKGATVIRPQVGFHRTPVTVVDFESKYPTEMKSHNLCSSTFVGDESIVSIIEPWLANNDKTPNQDPTSNEHIAFDDTTLFRTFWKLSQDKRFQNPPDEWHQLRPNILKVINIKASKNDSESKSEWSYFSTSFPSLVGEIIAYLKDTRVKLKKLLKLAKQSGNKLLEMIYDADQKAVKVIMNSLYGMFGANAKKGALMPCKCVAKSVTSIGREEIQISRHIAETKFNAIVVYGDTDSLFVKPKDNSMDYQQAFRLGDQLSHYITNVAFGKKAVLATEKMFCPFLVPKKKTYIGRKYTADFQPDPISSSSQSTSTPTTTSTPPSGTYKISKPEQGTTGTISNKLDSCDVHKEIFETMIEFLVMESDIKKSYMHLLYSLERLLNNWYPMEKLTCRNKLNDNDNTVIKAVVIRNKIASRAPGTEPKPGDIVPFVYIHNNNPKAKVLDTIEDPEYVRENGLSLGLSHYIYLLEGQVACYFVKFPSLKVPDLFMKCMELASSNSSGLVSMLYRPVSETAAFPKFIEKVLVVHLRQHFCFVDDYIQTILQVWRKHFVWTPVPVQFHRGQVTNETLFSELDVEMQKPHLEDDEKGSDEEDEEKNSSKPNGIQNWFPTSSVAQKRKNTTQLTTSVKRPKISIQ